MRLTTESFGGGDTTWLDSAHGTDHGATATFVVSNFTAATHYPDGHVPSGLPVNAADRADLQPWTGAAGEVLGFVLFDQAVAGQAKFSVPVILHGRVRTGRLPVAFTVPTSATAFVFNTGSDA